MRKSTRRKISNWLLCPLILCCLVGYNATGWIQLYWASAALGLLVVTWMIRPLP